jgi:cellulose synthase/poly-beta-1,6-N-acetylglucosamine synthase-like glycosyltransferase/peptidoglycan/xylan/chitin deacetylase (PgdA/CDA1 family)
MLLLFAIAGFGALLLQGFSEGSKAVARPGPKPPPAVARSGPVLDLTGARPSSARIPPRTVALTFDGGPDPAWTPGLLDVLRRHHTKATFFVVGARAAENPGLIRRMTREGHELGSNAYSQSGDLGAMPPWRSNLELDLTQQALAGVAGVHTRLVRLPYVYRPDALYGERWRAAQEVGERGNLLVLSDLDSRAATRPTAKAIAAAVTPSDGRGAVVTLPSIGGDRRATTAALDLLLTRLSQQGYRVTTVSEALRMPPATVPTSTGAKLTGKAVAVAQRGAGWLTDALTILFGIAGIFTTGRVLLLLFFARLHIYRRWRERRRKERREQTRLRKNRRTKRFRSRHATDLTTPSVSVIVPAYNEEAGILETVLSLVNSRYAGTLEVIVVDDGSTDGTADLVEALELPQVRLIRRPNGGKPAALNTGMSHARYEILVLVDGDTVFRPDTLGRLVAPLSVPGVGAVSGNTKVANRKGILGRWQHIEYVMGFNLDRRMFDVLECMPTVPGAIGAFRHLAVEEVGGFKDDTLAEDTDLTMALCRAGWRVVYEETAVAWTEVPSTLRQFWRQRYRWCYGTMQAMWKHKHAVFERGPSGRFGRRGLPYLIIYHVLLPLCAPAVDVLALYGIFVLNPWQVILMWLAFSAVQVLAGRSALWMDGESTRVIWTLPLQQFVYRQLLYLVVMQSLITVVLGARLRWQTIRRVGTFSHPDPAGSKARV